MMSSCRPLLAACGEAAGRESPQKDSIASQKLEWMSCVCFLALIEFECFFFAPQNMQIAVLVFDSVLLTSHCEEHYSDENRLPMRRQGV